jgi:gliding motility-associated-like protein
MKPLMIHLSSILSSMLFMVSASAQITLVQNLTPQQLVEQYLIGPGVSVSNVTFNGQPGSVANSQIGAFYGANSVLALDSGIVLATGPVSLVQGPNNSSGFTAPVTGVSLDVEPDLEQIAGMIFDAAVLEFDFVPQADTVSFRFVFGSEEYLEWVGIINDVFGFFVSGPGINGPYSNNAMNVALVPGTNDPVAINSINPFTNPDYYIDNGDGSTPPFSTDPYYIQFDGMTVELEARIRVVCGETYHMKMAIADASDRILDSGVFIVGGTFSSTGSVAMTINTTIGDGDLLEGCGNATLTITRTNTTEELLLPLVLLGEASAADVEGLPAEVLMEVGVATVQIDFTAVADGLVEGSELLEISTSVEGGCSGGNASASVLIVDVPPLLAQVEGELADCSGTPVDLVVLASGGFGDLVYSWSNEELGSSITVPGVPASYTVVVSDECGTEVQASIGLTIPCGIDIPNVFSPDRNGVNDFFVIEGIEFTRNTVRIYNRWGNVVFETANYRNSWDGRGLSDGTYFYEVVVEGHDAPYTGHLTILRNGG